MLEPEVQSLVAQVRGCGEVLHPLLGGHGTPFRVSLLVPVDIICLHQAVQHNVHGEYAEQLLVSASVQRRVVWMEQLATVSLSVVLYLKSHRRRVGKKLTGSVHIRRNDGAGLHKHVVAGGGHGTGPDGVGVPRVPCHLDWVR